MLYAIPVTVTVNDFEYTFLQHDWILHSDGIVDQLQAIGAGMAEQREGEDELS